MAAPVVDVHTHVLPPDFRRSRRRLVERDATFRSLFFDRNAKIAATEDLLETMEEEGVDVAVLLGYGWCDQGMARESNDYLIESALSFPGKFIPFCAVNPAWGNAALYEAERCASSGALGIGELHPDTQGFDIGNVDTMTPLMEVAMSHGLVVATHSSEPVGHLYPGKGSTTPRTLMRFITSFPDVPILCAHWGGGLPFYALMPEVRRTLSNVYFDTAASPLLYDMSIYPTATKLVGHEKILFGSDYPLLKPNRLISEIHESLLDPNQQASILGRNAARLLAIPHAVDAKPRDID